MNAMIATKNRKIMESIDALSGVSGVSVMALFFGFEYKDGLRWHDFIGPNSTNFPFYHVVIKISALCDILYDCVCHIPWVFLIV